jgi:hypothetical protein
LRPLVNAESVIHGLLSEADTPQADLLVSAQLLPFYSILQTSGAGPLADSPLLALVERRRNDRHWVVSGHEFNLTQGNVERSIRAIIK